MSADERSSHFCSVDDNKTDREARSTNLAASYSGGGGNDLYDCHEKETQSIGGSLGHRTRRGPAGDWNYLGTDLVGYASFDTLTDFD